MSYRIPRINLFHQILPHSIVFHLRTAASDVSVVIAAKCFAWFLHFVRRSSWELRPCVRILKPGHSHPVSNVCLFMWKSYTIHVVSFGIIYDGGMSTSIYTSLAKAFAFHLEPNIRYRNMTQAGLSTFIAKKEYQIRRSFGVYERRHTNYKKTTMKNREINIKAKEETKEPQDAKMRTEQIHPIPIRGEWESYRKGFCCLIKFSRAKKRKLEGLLFSEVMATLRCFCTDPNEASWLLYFSKWFFSENMNSFDSKHETKHLQSDF